MRSVVESNQKSAEVIVMFEESVIAVRHLRAGERFVAGNAGGVDLEWPVDGAEALVQVSPAGAIELRAPRVLTGSFIVELLDDASRPVLEAVHFVDELDSGARVTTLASGKRARVQLGDVTLLVGEGEAPVRRPLPPPLDLRIHTATGAMALCFLLALIGINAIPPQPMSLEIDPFALSMRGVRMRFQPPVEEVKPDSAPKGTSQAPATARKTDTPRFVRIAGNLGESRTSRAKSKAERKMDAQDAAANSGMLGTIHAFEGSHTGAVFGPGTAFGDSAYAFGEIGGTANGEEAGSLAVDRLGARTGGSTDTIGVGPVGGPVGKPDGYGKCKDCSLHEHKAKMGIDMAMTTPDVHGPIDKELIRRAVRSQSAAFRFCYERELQHNNDLSGRVVTRFTIAPNGKIVAALTQESTLKSTAVDSCVADVFKRIQLPAMPANMGVSIVTYPLAFHSAAQGQGI